MSVLIKMLVTRVAAADGVRPFVYEEGKEYRVPRNLAALFASSNSCEIAVETTTAKFQANTPAPSPDAEEGGVSDDVAAAGEPAVDGEPDTEPEEVEDNRSRNNTRKIVIADGPETRDTPEEKPKRKPRKARKFKAEEAQKGDSE